MRMASLYQGRLNWQGSQRPKNLFCLEECGTDVEMNGQISKLAVAGLLSQKLKSYGKGCKR